MIPAWLRYEARALGVMALVVPVLVALLCGGLAGLMALAHARAGPIATLLSGSLEIVFPLAAGIVAASVVGHEAALEVQLTLPTPYRATVLRRLVLLLGWTACVALTMVGALAALGLWRVRQSFAVGQFVWLAPLLWFIATGAVAALLLHSRTASGGVLAGMWVFEIAFGYLMVGRDWLRPWFLFASTYTPGADYWLLNRIVLTATALLLGGVAWVLLGRTEAHLLGGEE